MTSALEKRVIPEVRVVVIPRSHYLVNLTKGVLILCIRCTLTVQCSPASVLTLVGFLVCSLSPIAILKQDVTINKQKNVDSLTETSSSAIRPQSLLVSLTLTFHQASGEMITSAFL